ncbi:MAG: segregation/condensation protein A [Clostridia bacterium]|nr:segregation/condensation protein A [Clostridia bacterium]
MNLRPNIRIESLDLDEPLDVLLMLVSKNKYDIFDIPIADICAQYMAYLDVLRADNIEVASEFLEMAARLVYIKTAMLLPKNEEAEQLRQQLSVELMEHQVARLAAQYLRECAKFDRFSRAPMPYEGDYTYTHTHDALMLAAAYLTACGKGRAKAEAGKSEYREYVAKPMIPVSWGERRILDSLHREGPLPFDQLLEQCAQRGEIVAMFMALLELMKVGKVVLGADMMVASGGRDIPDKEDENNGTGQ